MRSLVVLALVAAVTGVPAGDPVATPSPVDHTRTFTVQPSGQLQDFSLACEPGEELIGGGYSALPNGLRVQSSYPTGGHWTVQAANVGKTPAELVVEANCAAGGTSTTQVVENKGQLPTVAVQCPEGTVVIAGGYLVTGAYVTGNHPLGDNGWGVDAEASQAATAAPGTPQIEVFGVCAKGANLVSADPAQLNNNSTFTGTCGAGQVVSSLGYELVNGRLLPYTVVEATSSRVSVNSDSTFTLQIITMCINWPPPAVVPVSSTWPLVAGIGGLLLLLALVAVYAMRRARRGRAAGAVDVVIRSEQGGFGLDRWREVP